MNALIALSMAMALAAALIAGPEIDAGEGN